MEYTRRQRFGRLLLSALLAVAVASTAAQQAVPQGNYNDYSMPGGQQQQQEDMRVSTTMIALLSAAVAVFVIIAMATIYLRHCTGYGYSYGSDVGWSADLSTGSAAPTAADTFVSRWQRRAAPRGLGAGVIESFPTMRYAEAKEMRVGKVDSALECAVCLSEFEDEEKLRFLPKCSHAFHPDCIGEWLASHVTCPVCRCNLDPNKDATSTDVEMVILPASTQVNSEVAVLRQDDGAAVVIDVVTEEEEERRRETMELQRIGTQRRAMRTARLVRAHSTGHSHDVLRLDRDLERFTLRIPEHVRMAMVVASGELISSRRRRQRNRFRRSFVSLTGRLPSFFSESRTADRSDGGGEVSSSSSSWARFKGKRVNAVDDAAESSAKVGRIGGSVSGAKAGAVVSVDVEKAGG